jgi:phosphatidylserine/phosphatidylglycerophosphate/cardiolipin synthase-like enzyme
LKLLIQPAAGIDPLIEGLKAAEKTIQILIFRIDRPEIERALVEAVQRGVAVQALIAYTNRGGDKNLRSLEMRLLEKGVTVARTSDDLVRYHGKMFIVDRKVLYLLAFNYTQMDIRMSRSFGLVVSKPSLVKEACKLFDCDMKRLPYEAGEPDFVVSPANAREELTRFIAGATHQLLLYEMKISDPDFIAMLTAKVSEGVDVRIITRMQAKTIAAAGLQTRALKTRLHARAIIRDGKSAFLGSQSLRRLEMEARREIGVITHNNAIAKEMLHVFEDDWKISQPTPVSVPELAAAALDMPAKKVAKSVAKHINMRPIIEQLLDKVIDTKGEATFEPEAMAQAVRDAFRDEVHDAVVHALQEMTPPETAHAQDKTGGKG